MKLTGILRSIALLTCLLSGWGLTHAQSWEWSAEASRGYALPHRDEMLALVTGHSTGVALRLGSWTEEGWRANWSAKGRVWQGLELGWLSGGSAELGDVASALWRIDLPLRPRLHFELGTGLGWATAPYDPVERPLSIAIGTRLNAGLHLGTAATVLEGASGRISIGAGLTHFSNGSLALPNLGINNVHIRLRASRSTAAFATPQMAAFPEAQHGWKFSGAFRAGARDVNLPGGPLHPILGGALYAERSKKPSHSWAFALELAHNQSLRAYQLEPLLPWEKLQLSSLAGVQLHFGNLHLMMLQGWVWTRPDQALGRYQMQSILAYDCAPSWSIELGLRSFNLRADYPFLGVRLCPAERKD